MLTFHRLVQRDADRALRRYELVSDELRDSFWAEFLRVCNAVARNPGHYHFDTTGHRRANLRRFPYHLLYFEELKGVRVVALRHHRQNPKFGIRRW